MSCCRRPKPPEPKCPPITTPVLDVEVFLKNYEDMGLSSYWAIDQLRIRITANTTPDGNILALAKIRGRWFVVPGAYRHKVQRRRSAPPFVSPTRKYNKRPRVDQSKRSNNSSFQRGHKFSFPVFTPSSAPNAPQPLITGIRRNKFFVDARGTFAERSYLGFPAGYD